MMKFCSETPSDHGIKMGGYFVENPIHPKNNHFFKWDFPRNKPSSDKGDPPWIGNPPIAIVMLLVTLGPLG